MSWDTKNALSPPFEYIAYLVHMVVFGILGDLDDMNIEIMRTTLYKENLEDFYRFCQVCPLLNGGCYAEKVNHAGCSIVVGEKQISTLDDHMKHLDNWSKGGPLFTIRIHLIVYNFVIHCL